MLIKQRAIRNNAEGNTLRVCQFGVGSVNISICQFAKLMPIGGIWCWLG